MGVKRKAAKVLFCTCLLILSYAGFVRAGSGLTGVVAGVDVFGSSMAVRWNKTVVVFDLANPQLKGYKALSDIRKGDTVTVTYLKNGVRIAKGAQAPEERKEEVRKAADGRKNEARKGTKDGRVRVAHGSRGTSFEDVDENKDGTVSAAELSQIAAGLSMQQFRQYDRNGDGRLDRKEFYAIDPRSVGR
jgi:hypothetical protein